MRAMLELKYLREHAEDVKKALARKKFAVDIDAFLVLDAERRERMTAFEVARAEQKSAGEKVASMDRSSGEFTAFTEKLRKESMLVKKLESSLREIEKQWQIAYLSIPNIPHESVPEGNSEHDNVPVYTCCDVDSVSKYSIPHYEIPWFANAIDFTRGVKVTGAGFPFYIGQMAKLVRALIQFFLDCAEKSGYTEFLPPILVNASSATATGQLPDKDGMMYYMQVDDFFAVP
jgi:seryl-tRNA synthetase